MIVHNDPEDPDALPNGWSPRELFRIGSIGGEDPSAVFGRIRGLGLDSKGNAYVLDGQASVVRVFDALGRHVRDIGRAGQGPGEFESPNGLIIAGDSTIWVRDSANRRYSVFSTNGALLREYVRSSGAGNWDAVIDDDGRIWEPAVRLVDPESLTMQPYYRALVPTGDALVEGRSIERDAAETPRWPVRETTINGQTTSGFIPVPFRHRLEDRIDPGRGVWVGESTLGAEGVTGFGRSEGGPESLQGFH